MLQYKGESGEGQEFLLTVHDDGTHEVATRRFPWETWSAPLDMQLVTASSSVVTQ